MNLVVDELTVSPHWKQKGQWLNGMYECKPGYRVQDIPTSPHEVSNEFKAVQDKYRFGLIHAGRYDPQGLIDLFHYFSLGFLVIHLI